MQSTVSRPSIMSHKCVKCRPVNLKRNIVVHAQPEKNIAKDLSNVLLGCSLTATFSAMTNCGSVQAAEYADEMFKIVQERSGKEFGKGALELKEAPAVSQRDQKMKKLLSQEGAIQEESTKSSAPEVTTSKTVFSSPSSSSSSSSFASSSSSSSSSPFAAEDGTFKSASQVQIGGAVAAAVVIGGVLYTNTKSKSETSSSIPIPTPTPSKSTPTPASQNGAADELKEAEAWVASWKSGGSSKSSGSSNSASGIQEAEAWVANWKAKSTK